jgi:hypothetical protein
VSGTLYPGNMILAIENSPADLQARVYRQGFGGNQAKYLDFYLGDTLTMRRLTVDVGVRYDRQWGKALPSNTLANTGFPNVVPGIVFAGYDAPFTWNEFSPRAGVTYALDDGRKTVARASFSLYSGQLNTASVGYVNPTSNAGYAAYRWNDINRDHFAQTGEVDLNQFITASGGFNPANPTAVTSPNVIDPGLKAPRTASVVAGIDHELMPNLAVQVNYSYTKTTDLLGNFTNPNTPRVGVSLADYTPSVNGFAGTLPDGTPYNVTTFIPNAARVAGGGNGFLLTNIPDFYTDYHGIEFSLVKRLSNRWMSRVGVSWNNAREHFTSPAGRYDTNGNPTPTTTEPLVDGGQFVPQAGASGLTSYINAKWQFNANGMYQAAHGIEVSANLFGRQGYPFPLFRQSASANPAAGAMGADSGLQVLVTPTMDFFRYESLWDTDLRVARAFKVQKVTIRAIGDLFNVFNANTILVRNNNLGSTSFNAISQNLSPRIFRAGLVVGF